MKIVIEGKHVQDVENESRYYVELPDGWRIIFEDDDYRGCYYAGEEEKVEEVPEFLKKDLNIGMAPKDLINDIMNIMNNIEESKEIIDDLLKTRTMATEQKDGTTVVVASNYPINPVVKDDPMSIYFDGSLHDWFEKHHYAHPEQCARLVYLYKQYSKGKNDERWYDVCENYDCNDCIIISRDKVCSSVLSVAKAALGDYDKETLFTIVTDIVNKDKMIADKYGDYYDPDKFYAGKGGIVCAGNCYHVKNIRKENRRVFDSLAEALVIGKCRECKHCHGIHKK